MTSSTSTAGSRAWDAARSTVKVPGAFRDDGKDFYYQGTTQEVGWGLAKQRINDAILIASIVAIFVAGPAAGAAARAFVTGVGIAGGVTAAINLFDRWQSGTLQRLDSQTIQDIIGVVTALIPGVQADRADSRRRARRQAQAARGRHGGRRQDRGGAEGHGGRDQGNQRPRPRQQGARGRRDDGRVHGRDQGDPGHHARRARGQDHPQRGGEAAVQHRRDGDRQAA